MLEQPTTIKQTCLFGASVAVAILSACGVNTAGGEPPGTFRDAGVRSQLALTDGVTVWFVFDPATCTLRSHELESLNELFEASDGLFEVRGVMTGAPDSPQEAADVIEAFGLRFPVEVDSADRWREWMQEVELPSPLFGVVRRGDVVLLGSKEVLPMLPSAVGGSNGGW